MWGYLVLKVLSIFNIFSAPHTYPTCIEKMFVKDSKVFYILEDVVLEDDVIGEIVSILFIL